MLSLQYSRSSLLPFSGQPARVPLVLMRGCGEQGDRKWVEVESFEDTVDRTGPITAVVDPVESILPSVHLQCRHIEFLAVRRSSGDTGCDADTDVVESTRFLHHGVHLLCIRRLWV